MGQDSEEAAEFVATVRGDHVAMKQWYTTATNADVQALRDKYGPYPGLWKEVLNWPGWKEARKEYIRHTQRGAEAEGVRKRKSRWGSATNESEDGDNKRRSRWGADSPAARPQAPMAMGQPGNGPVVALPLPGLPGLPSQLPAHKAEEMMQLQSRLREINRVLDNLEAEASRVDALPKDHRDRSPSPPPGK